ncbi:hypothetical protein QBC38DRAFT_484898 [Podospora fimiseda]|uniref:DUF7580 domain-containing protein n=1 Tax=Podospora fimiseda TaxID=252190 RepID=A0AAN7BK05_9PEZI|nr:hypothetical protein QBC38DRAFT_484898 [Podospora fimiseda]
MSGLESMGLILGLYPVILDITKTYKSTRANGLSAHRRSIMILETLYTQTCTGLLESVLSPEEARSLLRAAASGSKDQSESLWRDPFLQKKLDSRLGPEKLSLALELLDEMRSSLNQVKSELTDMCRGSDGFGRVKATIKMTLANMPGSAIRDQIKHLKELNSDLRDLLNDKTFMIPYQQRKSHDTGASVHPCPAKTVEQATELFETISHNYACECRTGHTIGAGCFCPHYSLPAHVAADRPANASCNLFLACTMTTSTLPSAVQLGPILTSNTTKLDKITRDICSTIQNISVLGNHQVILDIPKSSKKYRMEATRLETTAAGKPCMLRLPDLIRYTGISPKIRSEMAWRLSLTMAHLCQTPWVSDSWSAIDAFVFNQFTATPMIFFIRDIYSAKARSSAIVNTSTPNQRPIDLFDDEPVLTKLGLVLIELALGRFLDEIRDDYSGFSAIDDKDLANICIARKLLDTGVVRNHATAAYEKAVSVCIKRQYIDSEGVPRSLLTSHESFILLFNDAVVSPLSEVCSRYEG